MGATWRAPWQPRSPSLDRENVLVDRTRLIQYRYERLQNQLAVSDCVGALLCSPPSIRYATDTHYAQGTNMHSPFRFVFVPAEGKATTFEGFLDETERPPPVVKEQRLIPITPYFVAGESYSERTQWLAKEVGQVVDECDAGKKLAVDTIEPELSYALSTQGIQTVNADPLLERAGSIKSADELGCIRQAIQTAERGLCRIREMLQPGVTERELWAELVHENALAGGLWFEYACLCSGDRTNPWGRECTDKTVTAGELVGIDTGLTGGDGYGADISRTFFCEPGRPSDLQKQLYQSALDNLRWNIEHLKPGISFREFAQRSWPVPDEYWARRYNAVVHGVGMGNEWPHVPFAADWEADDPRDGHFQENMVLAVESCIGREEGNECVKLEEMVVLTADGCELLSTFPFESVLAL